jgi:predicted Zn-dependent peptidase
MDAIINGVSPFLVDKSTSIFLSFSSKSITFSELSLTIRRKMNVKFVSNLEEVLKVYFGTDLISNVEAPVEEKELQKVKNKSESLMAFEDMSLMNRANSLAYYELLGDANLMNQEMQQYNSVTTEQVKALSAALFAKENSNTLYYLSDKRI